MQFDIKHVTTLNVLHDTDYMPNVKLYMSTPAWASKVAELLKANHTRIFVHGHTEIMDLIATHTRHMQENTYHYLTFHKKEKGVNEGK